MTIKITDDKELAQDILNKLKENQEKYGKRYCPCIPPYLYNSDDNVCICKSFEAIEEGTCHCGLFIKVKD